MNDKEQKNSIDDKIIDKIKKGEIKMKPRIFFILKIFLMILGALSLFFFIIYLISFIIFSLRASGALFLPRFGFLGVRMLFGYLPWFLIGIVLVLIIFLEIFSKRFTFIYRRPIIYSLLIIIILVLAIGFLIERTSLHSGLFLSARDRNLPFMGPFYRNFGAPPLHDVHHGIVAELIESGLIIETPRNEGLKIITTSETKIISKKEIKEGDELIIFGEREDGTVNAVEIRQIEKDFNLFPPDRIHKNRPLFNQ